MATSSYTKIHYSLFMVFFHLTNFTALVVLQERMPTQTWTYVSRDTQDTMLGPVTTTVKTITTVSWRWSGELLAAMRARSRPMGEREAQHLSGGAVMPVNPPPPYESSVASASTFWRDLEAMRSLNQVVVRPPRVNNRRRHHEPDVMLLSPGGAFTPTVLDLTVPTSSHDEGQGRRNLEVSGIEMLIRAGGRQPSNSSEDIVEVVAPSSERIDE